MVMVTVTVTPSPVFLILYPGMMANQQSLLPLKTAGHRQRAGVRAGEARANQPETVGDDNGEGEAEAVECIEVPIIKPWTRSAQGAGTGVQSEFGAAGLGIQ